MNHPHSQSPASGSPNTSGDAHAVLPPRADEEQLRLLINGVTEYAIFMLDAHGVITNWNTGAQRIKGYTADEIIGKHFSIFYTEEDRQAGVPARALQAALERGMYQAQSWRVRKGGIPFMAEVLIEPLRDTTGRLVGFAKLTRDISERVQQQKALEESRAALARVQRLADFRPMHPIAHDLNNLLQVIRTCAELLRRRLQGSDSETYSLVEVVMRNAEGAANLTSELLKFARRQEMEPSIVNVNELIAGMVDLIRQWLGETVTVETVLAGALWDTSADTDQLKTALLNLIIHARNSSQEAGKLTIETCNVTIARNAASPDTAEVPAGDYVTIAVRDQGTGMSSGIMAKTVSGTGERANLGLAQVYGFVQQASGHVTIDSAPGAGTTVKLYLPRASGPSSQTKTGDSQRPDRSYSPPSSSADASASSASSSPLAGLRVLVIEDEALIAMFVEDLLDQLGCTLVGVCSSVAEGLATAQQAELDLALLDVNVAGQPVYPVAQALERRGLPMVFMSGYRQLDESWRARPSVQKPFDLEQLAAAMKRAVHDKEACV
jgi:PAS domain S-box-containing protein